MGNLKAFAENVERYDKWFVKHFDLFLAEVTAIHKVIPDFQRGLEIGVGSGQFAAALGINFGIDPVPEMLEKAAARGIEVQEGFAENLPDLGKGAFVAITSIKREQPDKSLL